MKIRQKLVHIRRCYGGVQDRIAFVNETLQNVNVFGAPFLESSLFAGFQDIVSSRRVGPQELLCIRVILRAPLQV
jgi:hypothetical protein